MMNSLPAIYNLETLRQNYKPQIMALSEKYGIENIRIFGSVARGCATPTSDIDFLVKLRPTTSLLSVAGMWGDLNDLLGRKVDIISEATIPYYARHILDEAVNL